MRPPLAEIRAGELQICDQRLSPGLSNITFSTYTKQSQETLRIFLPVGEEHSPEGMGERQAKDIALAERESAEVCIDARHGLIPGEKVPARIRDVGRGRAHAIQNVLERGADGCGEGVGIGGLLFAGQEKQMVALCCIQIKDPCQALQDLCGNQNSAALLQAGIPGHSDAC